jgi:hypothetical protein
MPTLDTNLVANVILVATVGSVIGHEFARLPVLNWIELPPTRRPRRPRPERPSFASFTLEPPEGLIGNPFRIPDKRDLPDQNKK